VDAVVIDDKVNATRSREALRQVDEQLAEEVTGLLEVADGVHAPGEYVEGAGDVELLVLARRDEAPLMTAQHPIAADLRVLLDVDFICIEHGLDVRGAGFQIADLLQDKLLSLARPRAEHDGLGPPEPRTKRTERAAHRAH
jgi:hypothetical protein